MGLFFRKSKSIGAFRLNFSKSGMGVSTGIKGARLSFGPKGTYVNLGSNGVYFRKKLGSKGKNKNTRNAIEPIKYTLDNYNPEVNISSESMLETEFENNFIRDIKRARIFNILWIILLILSLYAVCIVPVLSLLAVLLIVLRVAFKNYFRAHIDFELDQNSQTVWENFISSLELIKSSKKVWLIESSRIIYDLKHNAGAGRNINRSLITSAKKLTPNKNNSWRIRTNNYAFQLISSKCKLMFLPNMFLVIHKGSVTGYSYKNLHMHTSTTRFIEDSQFSVPKDAQIIDWTWQYVNRNGGPDLRYKQNPKRPVCLYGVFKLTTDNGLGLEFQTSNINVSATLESDFKKYTNHIKNLEMNTPADNKISKLNDVNKTKEEPTAQTSMMAESKQLKVDTNNRLIEELVQHVLIEGKNNE